MGKNKGITLVEIIIVVAIIGIFAGGVALTFSIVNSADVTGCTQSIDSTLEKTKNECMTKANARYMVLYKSTDPDHSGFYVGSVQSNALASFTPNPDADTKVGGAKLQITVTPESGPPIDVASNAVYFTFDRSSGAFKNVYKGIPATDALKCPASITVTNGSRTSVIHCVQATGKHFIE